MTDRAPASRASTTDRAARRLQQVIDWDPLDLTEPGLPPVEAAPDREDHDATGIQPDTDTRPELRPVRRVTSPGSTTPSAGSTTPTVGGGAALPPAPWER